MRPDPRQDPVRWLQDEADRKPLNDLLDHNSVLELGQLAEAAVKGQPFTVDELDDIVPRPGWEIWTRAPNAPDQHALRQMGAETIRCGPRRELLLLLELAVRSAIAPHIGQPPPRGWVQRLRDAHPKLLAALGDEARFERVAAG